MHAHECARVTMAAAEREAQPVPMLHRRGNTSAQTAPYLFLLATEKRFEKSKTSHGSDGSGMAHLGKVANYSEL